VWVGLTAVSGVEAATARGHTTPVNALSDQPDAGHRTARPPARAHRLRMWRKKGRPRRLKAGADENKRRRNHGVRILRLRRDGRGKLLRRRPAGSRAATSVRRVAAMVTSMNPGRRAAGRCNSRRAKREAKQEQEEDRQARIHGDATYARQRCPVKPSIAQNTTSVVLEGRRNGASCLRPIRQSAFG